MGVFLRWGIFGILSVAALVYAFNSLSRMAEHRKLSAAPVVPAVAPNPHSAPAAPVPAVNTPDVVAAPPEDAAVPARCRAELDIAQRAVASRSIGEPLDRLLRIQEIAWQEDAKLRERFTAIATRWYAAPGPVDSARLRTDVVDECVAAKP